MNRVGGRSAYDSVYARDLDINQTILVTFDPDAVTDRPGVNPGLPGEGKKPLLLAGQRTGALRGTIQIFKHVVDADLVTITTEHGTVLCASGNCPVWKVRS